jgi:hypothetical protein
MWSRMSVTPLWWRKVSATRKPGSPPRHHGYSTRVREQRLGREEVDLEARGDLDARARGLPLVRGGAIFGS